MQIIDYNWDESDQTSDIDNNDEKLPSRSNLQLARRLFHMGNGFAVATLYWLSFSHQQMIHFLGTISCVLYVVEQIRINYPELSNRFIPLTRFIMRAEEQLKESAMVPYAFAVLLTIITFPKPIALIAIYTLAISDPLSAIVGIKYGKRRIVPHKSLEGSLAFFISTFLISLSILSLAVGGMTFIVFFVSLVLAFSTSIFEMLPLKIDDNLTIPLVTAFTLWILVASFDLTI
jgi:dolichol kinase